jgi:hypothetical protein
MRTHALIVAATARELRDDRIRAAQHGRLVRQVRAGRSRRRQDVPLDG